MKRSRIAYILSLAAVFLFYVLDTGYFSQILLLVTLCFPILSFILGLFFMWKSDIKWECEEKIVTGNPEFSSSVRLRCAIPVCAAFVRLQFQNQFTGKVKKKSIFLRPGSAPQIIDYRDFSYGVISLSVRRCHLVDPAGLLPLPLKKPKEDRILLRPEEIPFTGSLEDIGSPNRPTLKKTDRDHFGTDRELIDVKDYQAGDPIRDIHWKLSARSQKIIVREFSYQTDEAPVLGIAWIGSPEKMIRSLARLFGMCSVLIQNGEPHSVLCVISDEKNGIPSARSFEVKDRENIADIAWYLLSSPIYPFEEKALRFLRDQPFATGRVFFVTPDETVFSDTSEEKGG